MNAPPQAASRVLPSSLSAWSIPGLQRRPSTILSGACELGLPTSLALLAELILACELGLLTSLALLTAELVLACELGLLTSLAPLARELVLATETEAHFPLETGIRFPLELETGIHFPLELEMEACFPLETRIRFPMELETNTCFPLVLNVLILSAHLSAPFVLSPTHSCYANCSLVKGSIEITGIRGTLPS
jgi:hypothetical protein